MTDETHEDEASTAEGGRLDPFVSSCKFEKIASKLDDIAVIAAEMKSYHIAEKYSYAAKRIAVAAKVIKGLEDGAKKDKAVRKAKDEINAASMIL